MKELVKEPLYREDDDELIGFVAQDTTGWQAQTLFGYIIARTEDRVAAERIVNEQGLSFLMGVWNYLDADDRDWHPCVIKEANQHKVTVIRTNEMGYQDPDDYKIAILKAPFDEVLIKIS